MLADGLAELDLEDSREGSLRDQNEVGQAALFNEDEQGAATLPTTPPMVSISPTFNQESRQADPNFCDSFSVKVTHPAKVGDGMSAYVVYRVEVKTTLPIFRSRELCVTRRFSDFLGLHEKLQLTHLKHGIIIPPAPEKDVLGSTKVRITKDAILENEFVEKRRLALERFLVRILSHPVLRSDVDLREFLEFEGDLPRATNTQILSSNSALKIIKNFGDAVGKLTHKVEDVDEYFDEKMRELESWERQLKQLHAAFSALTSNEQELATSGVALSRSISLLANVEEHTGLAQALSRLAETEEQSAQYYALQSEAGATFLVECAHDLLCMIQACKDVLNERSRLHRNWRAAESALRSKKEQHMKLEASSRADQRKLSTLSMEADELAHRVEQGQKAFDAISKTIKSEFDRFDMDRFINFKVAATEYLKVMLQVQTKLLESWETYLVHAKSIT